MRWLDLTLEGLALHRQRQIARAAYVGAIFLLAVITILTLIPDTMGGDIETFGIDDKVGHALAYVSLMGTWAFAVATPLARVKAMGALALYGAILEGLQGLLGFGRQASWQDEVANCSGLLIGLTLAVVAAQVIRWAARKRSVET